MGLYERVSIKLISLDRSRVAQDLTRIIFYFSMNTYDFYLLGSGLKKYYESHR